MKKAWLTKLMACTIALFFLSLLTQLPVQAANTDYTLVEGHIQMPIPETYTLKKVINNPAAEEGFNGFSEPSDLYINGQGHIYVADSGNNRIVKMSPDGRLLGVFTGPEDRPMNKPQGVFADDGGDMYIADTGNYRILHLAADGSYVEEFGRPVSDKLDADFIFDPTKVIVSRTGYIYALKGQYLITMDGFNNFRGYVGQSKISFSLREVLIRMFASDKQQQSVRTRIAASYTNIALGPDNMIYASTLDTYEGELKKLNSIGSNIYKKYPEPISETIRMLTKLYFDDIPFAYGDRNLSLPSFSDLAVDKEGIVTVIDKANCRLFQYDKDGNLLTIFGNYGDRDGYFLQPVSVIVDKEGCLYVLDKAKNNIQVFEPTFFITNVHGAVAEYNKGDYEKARSLWEAVLKTGENYQLANAGMAQASFKQEKWTDAMAEYKLAGDRLGYSKAFDKYRHSMFRGNFFLVVIGMTALVCALAFAVVVLKKTGARAVRNFETRSESRFGTGNMLMLSAGVMFHPVDVFRIVRESRGKLKLRVGLIIMTLAVAVRVFFIYTVHYPLVEIDPRNANLVLEIAKILLPLLTFVIASYAVTAIVGGESKLSEIFTASCFCMVPYVLINAVLAPLSHIMCRSEEGLFTFAVKLALVSVLLLLFISVLVLNNYSMVKTVAVSLLSVFATVLAWIVVLLILSLSAQLVEFISGIFRELHMAQL